MKLLSMLLVVVATLSVASCKDKKSAPAQTTESGSAAPKAPPEPPKPVLPAECEEYRVAIEKLAACEALPLPSREALKKSYEAAAAKWATVPPDGKTGLANTCKAGAEAINKTLASCK